MNHAFPINYFASLAGPTRLFAGRKQLSWPKFVLVLIFLISLMVMPITLYYANSLQSLPLNNIIDTTGPLIDNAGLKKFQQLEVVQGRLQLSQTFSEQASEVVIGSGLTAAEKKDSTYIDFEAEQWVISQSKNGRTRSYTMTYSQTFDPGRVTTPAEFQSFIEREFYQSNRPMIVLSYSLSLGLILMVMTALLLFGASFFLWMTRKSSFSSITTFKESANLMLNVIGVGSILAALVGLIHFDFVWLLGIQSTTAVLLLLWIFTKTHFKDAVSTDAIS